MGALQSTDDNVLPWEDEALALWGFHVLKLKPNSPAELAGLTPYFDIILAVNGQTSFKTIQEFAKYISQYLDQEVTLSVLSLRTRSLRELKLFPRLGWSSNPKDGLLGCSVRFSSVERALESVWRILDITPQSPAERAGLQSNTDYVIGCEYRNLENENDLYELVQEHEDKLLSLLVYNSVWNTCREVVIIPKLDWGGEGLLGCGVGYGLLHRIPCQVDEPTLKPQNQIFPEVTAPAPSGLDKTQDSPVYQTATLSKPDDTPITKVEESLQNISLESNPEISLATDSSVPQQIEAVEKIAADENTSNIPSELEVVPEPVAELPSTIEESNS